VDSNPERHLFLSPHYDDIPLSCGGTVTSLAARGVRPEIALIFGDYPDPDAPLTSFAERLHDEWGLAAGEVIDARRAEEAAASALIGATDIYLPFRDAIYRGSSYVSDELLFADPVEAEAELPQAIVDALDLSVPSGGELHVYAPLGIGRHVDHQVAFQAGRLLHESGVRVRFYEDLPYALEAPHVTRRMDDLRGQVENAEKVPVEEVWQTKIEAIMAFPSQVGVIFERYVGVQPTRPAISDAMHDYAVAAGDGVAVEQFWKLTDR
jgi:LmbE family N-acetylglucosaminyl deacetylase